jgi:hypothetical protein
MQILTSGLKRRHNSEEETKKIDHGQEGGEQVQ